MPSTVRTISRLYLTLAAALVIIGALVISLLAVAQSASTGACVNRVLGERAYATQLEQNARIADTEAELGYLRGTVSKQRRTDVSAAYRDAQATAAAYRAQHPAGRC